MFVYCNFIYKAKESKLRYTLDECLFQTKAKSVVACNTLGSGYISFVLVPNKASIEYSLAGFYYQEICTHI